MWVRAKSKSQVFYDREQGITIHGSAPVEVNVTITVSQLLGNRMIMEVEAPAAKVEAPVAAPKVEAPVVAPATTTPVAPVAPATTEVKK